MKKERKSKRNSGRANQGFPKPTHPPYDAEMIDDFLNQLMWDLRITHFEASSGSGTVNEELVEQVTNLARKRGCWRLIAFDVADAEGLAADDRQRAENLLKMMIAQQAQKYLDAFELLRPILARAIKCAASPQQGSKHVWNLRRILENDDRRNRGNPATE